MSPRKRRGSVLERRFQFHLRRLRIKAGLRQKELAEGVGFENANFVSMLENGIRGASPDTVEKLAEFFGVDPSEFYSPPAKVASSRTSRLANHS